MACLPWPGDDLRAVPTVLGQRLPGPRLTAETGLRLTAAGARAGLLVRGRTYAWIGLDGTLLVCRAAGEDAAEHDLMEPVALPAGAHVRLLLTVTDGAVVSFAAETAGLGRLDAGPVFQATPGVWIGATLALFATARAGSAGGHADFDAFTVQPPAGPCPA
jgi:hypothetical protein